MILPAIATELDALDLADHLIHAGRGTTARPGFVIVGALVIGLYASDGDKSQVLKMPIGNMHHWAQIGIHDEALRNLRAEKGLKLDAID